MQYMFYLGSKLFCFVTASLKFLTPVICVSGVFLAPFHLIAQTSSLAASGSAERIPKGTAAGLAANDACSSSSYVAPTSMGTAPLGGAALGTQPLALPPMSADATQSHA